MRSALPRLRGLFHKRYEAVGSAVESGKARIVRRCRGIHGDHNNMETPKTMRSRNHLYAVIMIAVAVTLMGGCTKSRARMRAFDVQVSLSPELQNTTVRVDLVGVNSAEKPRWDQLNRYWVPGGPLRKSAQNLDMVHEMDFGGDLPTTQTLRRNEQVWVNWKNSDVLWLYIVADLPASEDGPGVVSLDDKLWDRKTKTINVSIQSAGVFVRNAPLESSQ